MAEGIYGGWGNFGSAAAAMSLPTVALLFGGDNGWRYAVALRPVSMAFLLRDLWFYWTALGIPPRAPPTSSRKNRRPGSELLG